MNHVLVTGATGFIGIEVSRQLTARGLNPRLMVRRPLRGIMLKHLNVQIRQADLRSLPSILRAMEGIDTVIHLGARAAFESYRRLFPSIVKGSINLMKAAAVSGVRQVVFGGSLLVYPQMQHNISQNTVPMPISGYGRAKLEAERGEDIMESLDEALRVSSKASALTRQLLIFSKGGAPVRKAASITDVLQDSTAFTLRGSKVKCKFRISKELWPVKVDVGQFSQVIHNLVINAMQAMSGGGEMRLEADNIYLEKITNMPLTPGRYVVIKVLDHVFCQLERHSDY